MLSGHRAGSDADDRDDHLGAAQVHEPGAHADHVGDGVESPDLVEVHALGSDAVHDSLCHRQSPEDRLRQVSHRGLKRRRAKQFAMSAQVRTWSEAGASTWHRRAAKP